MDILSIVYSIQYLFIKLIILINSITKNNNGTNTSNEGISILIPSYDEVLTIEGCIKSILNTNRDFQIEIIIVDDGKGSATLNYLKRRYYFELIDEYKNDLKDINVRHVYMSRSDIRIYIIDKDNEGKAKALNTAIKIAHYKYFISIDGDTLIDKNCLMEMHKLLNDDVLGIGGRIVPVKHKGNILGKLLCFYQRWEYFRTFSSSRIMFNKINCVPLMSGALSLFNKQAVLDLKGYGSDTLGEDFDLTLKLHEYAKRNGGKVLYADKAIAYTQVPFDLKSFYRQRLRWQIGFLQVLKKHKKLLKDLSLLSLILNITNYYESLSVLLIIIMIFINHNTLILFTSLITTASMIELCIIKHYNDEIEDSNLLLLGLIQIIVSIFYLYIRLISLIKVFILKQNPSWGHITREKI